MTTMQGPRESDRFLLRFPSVASIASAPFRRRLCDIRKASDKNRELLQAWLKQLAMLEGKDCLRFNSPGNLLPGLGEIGRADDLLSIEGSWLYDESYQPDVTWTAHEADVPDQDDNCRYERYENVRKEAPVAAELFRSVCRRADASASPYYAILVLDGDHMGQWLTGRRAPKLDQMLAGFPEGLGQLSEKRRPLFPAPKEGILLPLIVARTILDLLLFARFLLREEHGIETRGLLADCSKGLDHEETAQ
jgi:hypothetical protein